MNQSTENKDKQTVANSEDHKTDQDFPGFPDSPATEKLIKPKTTEDKLTAAVNVKDGEKMTDQEKDNSAEKTK